MRGREVKGQVGEAHQLAQATAAARRERNGCQQARAGNGEDRDGDDNVPRLYFLTLASGLRQDDGGRRGRRQAHERQKIDGCGEAKAI